LKSTILVFLFVFPLMTHAAGNKVQRKVIAKPAARQQVAVKRPAPQTRTVAQASDQALKVIQETVIEIDEGD
jgi:hypothetical protein